MIKPSRKLLNLVLDITGERELEEYPKLLNLYTYTLDLENKLNTIDDKLKIKVIRYENESDYSIDINDIKELLEVVKYEE